MITAALVMAGTILGAFQKLMQNLELEITDLQASTVSNARR
jgi:hypothetical protein